MTFTKGAYGNTERVSFQNLDKSLTLKMGLEKTRLNNQYPNAGLRSAPNNAWQSVVESED